MSRLRKWCKETCKEECICIICDHPRCSGKCVGCLKKNYDKKSTIPCLDYQDWMTKIMGN